MGKTKNNLKVVRDWALVGAVVAGGVLAAEKSGLTDAFVGYNDAMCRVAFEAHKRYPLAVWGDYGNPDANPEARKVRYRIGGDVEAGVLAYILVGAGVAMIDNRRSKKFWENINYDKTNPGNLRVPKKDFQRRRI